LKKGIAVAALAAGVLAAGCRKRSPPEPPRRAPMTHYDCTLLGGYMSGGIAAAIAAANPPDRPGCSSDAECVEAPTIRCVKLCYGHGVRADAAAGFTAAIRTIDETYCTQWEEGRCDDAIPPSKASCAAATPRCVDGRCRMSEP
jgi:hypothetical protein